MHIERTAPHPGGHVFSLMTTIFKVNQGIHKTNVLTKFHDDWTKNVTSKEKDPSPRAAMFFLPIRTIFRLNRRIQETNVLTKFHKDWAKNGSSRLFTCFYYIHIYKTATPPGSHVFPLITTIFTLVRFIHITNVLTKFHDYKANKYFILYKYSPTPTSGHPSSPVAPCMRPVCAATVDKHYIMHPSLAVTPNFASQIGQARVSQSSKTVSSRLFTCFHYIHKEKFAPPPGGNVFPPIITIFELVRDIY
ncbi:hypothetical protein DPMN_036273 [Dreissena polymorpha]|uniref:Uncharacterized protein n=1 Tax=Dreissena polymorpha TaxID=45954 RepID=A0A9D4MAM5_DREPO|nr:hypothetical protein DPMN_036273 [Dreissena polymorpha]